MQRCSRAAYPATRLPRLGRILTDASARILHNIEEVSADIWDSCNNRGAYNPFLTHRFLHALEVSGSVTPQTGWQPFHLLVERGDEVIGAVPAYLKSHSQGEYVFDYSWADAWHRAGGDYYPKMQVSVPFTPATGPAPADSFGQMPTTKSCCSAR